MGRKKINMKEEEYLSILNQKSVSQCPPNIKLDTYLAIHRQERQRYLRNAFRKHRQDNNIKKYFAQYNQEESICTIANRVNFSPCMMARLLLEHSFGYNRKKVSEVIKNPKLIEDKRLRSQIEECIEVDPDSSPFIDRLRHNMGTEYEYILYEKLHAASIPFESEETLRVKGLSKTPDAKLVIPIGIKDSSGNMRLVNWIDSKAMFGDIYSHETENLDQVHAYVNRFGPGLVIYWFGFIDSLNKDPNILIADKFPDDIVYPAEDSSKLFIPLSKSISSQPVMEEINQIISFKTKQIDFDLDEDGLPSFYLIKEQG